MKRCCWSLLLLPGLACAQTPAQTLFIGGAQGSAENSYTYAGWIRPFAGGRVGDGWYGKVIASWLAYRYDGNVGGQPVEVKANAPGLEAGVGRIWTSGAWRQDLSLSVGARHTRIRPEGANSGAAGTRATLTPQYALAYDPTLRLGADLLAAYALGTGDRFGRLRGGWRPAAGWRLGVEGVVAAGRDYRNRQAGLFGGTQLGPVWLEVAGGQAQSRDGRDSGYFGISLSMVF